MNIMMVMYERINEWMNVEWVFFKDVFLAAVKNSTNFTFFFGNFSQNMNEWINKYLFIVSKADALSF